MEYEVNMIKSLGVSKNTSPEMPEMASQWPTLTTRHRHALQRTVTKRTAFIQPHVLTVLTKFEGSVIKSVGGVI